MQREGLRACISDNLRHHTLYFARQLYILSSHLKLADLGGVASVTLPYYHRPIHDENPPHGIKIRCCPKI